MLNFESPPSAHLGFQGSHRNWIKFRGAGQNEQRQIVAELDRARAKVRSLQEKWSGQIELLTERRQALITTAVTGQIEVPGANDRGGNGRHTLAGQTDEIGNLEGGE